MDKGNLVYKVMKIPRTREVNRILKFAEEQRIHLGYESSFDLFLEYQFGQTGSFYTALFDAMKIADPENLICFNDGFPRETAAYVTFTYVGLQKFLDGCTQGHPFIEKMREDWPQHVRPEKE